MEAEHSPLPMGSADTTGAKRINEANFDLAPSYGIALSYDFFFLMWAILKVFIEFVTILLPFSVLVFWTLRYVGP